MTPASGPSTPGGTSPWTSTTTYYHRDRAARPYAVGVVVDAGGRVWTEVPVRFNLDWTPPATPSEHAPLAARPWPVSSSRVVGRRADERLHGYRSESVAVVSVDLTAGREVVSLDIENESTLIWSGPGIALIPMAVGTIFHLHGTAAMIEHPGPAPLRATPGWHHGPDQLEGT